MLFYDTQHCFLVRKLLKTPLGKKSADKVIKLIKAAVKQEVNDETFGIKLPQLAPQRIYYVPHWPNDNLLSISTPGKSFENIVSNATCRREIGQKIPGHQNIIK